MEVSSGIPSSPSAPAVAVAPSPCSIHLPLPSYSSFLRSGLLAICFMPRSPPHPPHVVCGARCAPSQSLKPNLNFLFCAASPIPALAPSSTTCPPLLSSPHLAPQVISEFLALLFSYMGVPPDFDSAPPTEEAARSGRRHPPAHAQSLEHKALPEHLTSRTFHHSFPFTLVLVSEWRWRCPGAPAWLF